jgi:ATP phosphoribosyltransferase
VPIKLALPKGRLLDQTASLLDSAGWGISGYHQGASSYRLEAAWFPELSIKVFHEKDIPVQVAVGNYDLGICGRDWIEELLCRYPSSSLVKVKELGYGKRSLLMTTSRLAGTSALARLRARQDTVRIASEYPNLAESFAVRLRLRRFSIFPVWGAAEVYPPEGADLALIPIDTEAQLADYGLLSVSKTLRSSAFLIANKNSWESRDMRQVLTSIYGNLAVAEDAAPRSENAGLPAKNGGSDTGPLPEDTVWLALPDGHQQQPTLDLFNRAGIEIGDYSSPSGNRRPVSNLGGVRIKVIRPQDMPSQVANGNFDLAITGRDWLTEHLYQFPSSPVTELLDLGFGGVKIVAVVSKSLVADDVNDLGKLSREGPVPLRVASEYVNIADKYARDNHLGWYRVVPTWGASEGFLPEDADLLIENTQTGRTISRHNLRIIDRLFESTACLVGSTVAASSPNKKKRMESIVATLKAAVEG